MFLGNNKRIEHGPEQYMLYFQIGHILIDMASMNNINRSF